MALPAPAEISERRRQGLELNAQELDRNVYVLSTFNVDLLAPFLAESLSRAGRPSHVAIAPFGQAELLLADPSSELYALAPADLLYVIAPEDAIQPVFDATEAGDAELAEVVDRRLDEIAGQLETALARLPGTTCFVAALGTDRAPFPHVLDPHAPERRQVLVDRFTNGLRALSASSPRIVVVDWDWHVRRYGWDAVRDDRLWYLGRMRLNPTGCAALAELVATAARAYAGAARKVVAVDLDGTLWGGIVGEDGVKGLEIGGDGVGLAFQDFQRELLKLRQSGVLIVACSKNNPDDAIEVFDTHPEMVVRREHLAAERINWQDKATNLREIADELDLGLDSFVFLDDNPVERTWIQQALPEVLVPDLPDDPAARPRYLADASWFTRIADTAADKRRAATYDEQRQRRELRSTVDFDEFLATLDQRVSFDPLSDVTLARAAQMCQRTNQFNLTTLRYTPTDLEQLEADPDVEIFTLSVSDRFGDSGITGLAILRHGGEETTIDTLLMSCRVLGRRVEDAFLAFLAARAEARGARALVGRYVPTAKNGQAATFYADRGFAETGEGTFRLDLAEHKLVNPPGIAITVAAGA